MGRGEGSQKAQNRTQKAQKTAFCAFWVLFVPLVFRFRLYQLFETLSGLETENMLSELKAAPSVLVLPHNEKPDAIETTKRAVARAGYEFKTAP
jgi:hypothetical protein